jgi:hypothetical protein
MTPAEIFGLVALVVLGLILLVAIRIRLDAIQSRIAAVTRVEAKLDLLLKQADIKYDPYVHVSQDIIEALRANQKIKAIKLYREATGVELKEAKEFIEEVQRRAGMSWVPRRTPSVALDLRHAGDGAVQGIKRARLDVGTGFRVVLPDRAGYRGVPRSLRIRFRRCDPLCTHSPALPQQPNEVCRLRRPRAHEPGLLRSQHRCLSQLQMPAPFPAIWL